MGAFSFVALLGTLIEAREQGGRARAWSCATAVVLPWMCYAQTGLLSYVRAAGSSNRRPHGG